MENKPFKILFILFEQLLVPLPQEDVTNSSCLDSLDAPYSISYPAEPSKQNGVYPGYLGKLR